MNERKFSLYDVEQFIREAGADRVTEEAVLGLERELEKLAETLADKALRYARHAGRTRLIRKSDVLLTRKVSHQGSFAYRKPVNLRRRAAATKIASVAQR